MIDLTGGFSYQRPAMLADTTAGRLTDVGLSEYQPPALYLGLMLRNDDGSPVFATEDQVDVAANVVLYNPQQLGQGNYNGIPLSLRLDAINDGYLGLIGTLDESERGRLSQDWMPLAILVWAQGKSVGIITAAQEPPPATGIAAPVRSVSSAR